MSIRLRSLVPWLLILAFTTTAARARRVKLSPAKASYRESAFTVKRPPGSGWLQVPSAAGAVVLVREGAQDPGGGPDDSWSAQVIVVPATGATTPDALVAWMDREYRGRLMEDGRFEQRAWSATPEAGRGSKSCVRYRLAAIDRGAPGGEALLLDEHGLACDDGTRTVFAKVSWRGAAREAPATLATTVAAWLSGLTLAGDSGAGGAGGGGEGAGR